MRKMGQRQRLVLQHNARAKLREQGDALRQQQSQLAALQWENERLAKLTAGASVGSNQPEDLQRLRAEAAALQQQTGAVAKLREENRRLKASVATPQTPLQAREGAMVRMGYSKNWMLAFILYADKNQHQLPTDFEQAKMFLPKDAAPELAAAADQFEIVYQGEMARHQESREDGGLAGEAGAPDARWQMGEGLWLC